MLAVGLSLLSLLPSLLALGLPAALMHFGAKRELSTRHLRLSLGLLVILGVIAGGITVVWALLGPPEYRDSLFVVGAAMLIVMPLDGVRSLVYAAEGFGITSSEIWVGSVARLAILVFLFFTGTLSVVTATLTVVATSVLASAVWWSRIRRIVSRAHENDTVGGRSIARYSGAIWFGQIAATSNVRLDQIVLAFVTSAEQIGIYAVAVTWATLPLIFVSAAQRVTLVRAAARQDDPHSARVVRISAFAAVLLSIALAVAAPVVVPIMFGPAFHEVVVVTWWLLPGMWFGFHGYLYGALLAARGHPRSQTLGELLGLVVTLAGLIIFVPVFGAIGAAITSSITYAVVAVSWRLLLRRAGFAHRTVIPTRSDITWALARFRRGLA